MSSYYEIWEYSTLVLLHKGLSLTSYGRIMMWNILVVRRWSINLPLYCVHPFWLYNISYIYIIKIFMLVLLWLCHSLSVWLHSGVTFNMCEYCQFKCALLSWQFWLLFAMLFSLASVIWFLTFFCHQSFLSYSKLW